MLLNNNYTVLFYNFNNVNNILDNIIYIINIIFKIDCVAQKGGTQQ